MFILLIPIFAAVLGYLSQQFIVKVMKFCKDQIIDSMSEILKIKPLEESFPEDLKNAIFQYVTTSSHLPKKLKVITQIVSYFELYLFAALIFSLFVIKFELVESAKIIFTFLAGWMAIKTIGSFKQWENPYYGRATFYTFLIGSCLNIFAGIGVGLACFWLLSQVNPI